MNRDYFLGDALYEVRLASEVYKAMYAEDVMVDVAIHTAQREVYENSLSLHLREIAEETCGILLSGSFPKYIEAAYDILGDFQTDNFKHVSLNIIGSVLNDDRQDFGDTRLPVDIIRETIRGDLEAALGKRFNRRLSAGYGVWMADKAMAELLSSGVPVAYVVVAHEKLREHRQTLENKRSRDAITGFLVSEYEGHGENDLPSAIIRELISERLDEVIGSAQVA